MKVEQALADRNLTWATPRPQTNRVAAVQHGDLVYLSGRAPVDAEGKLVSGKVGRDCTPEEAYEGAKQAMVNLLGALKTEIGDLDRVTRVVKVLCLVNTADDFHDPGKVADGASDLLVELYGERGRHARSAVGIACPAAGLCIEIEMIVAVETGS